MQKVDLEGEGNTGRVMGKGDEGQQTIEGMFSRPITTMGKWSLILQANSWTRCKTCTPELSHSRGEEAG